MSDQQTPGQVTVRDNPDEHRFDVLVDGALAGFSEYRDVEPQEPDAAPARQRIFYHTEVFEQYGGRGLAGTLTREALTASVRTGHRIVAVCPYVKKWLTTHHDVDDAVDPVSREHLRALR
jgi:uncharacterized protein